MVEEKNEREEVEEEEAGQEREAVSEEGEKTGEQTPAAADSEGGAGTEEDRAEESEKELSEEELRQLIEESLEKVTVADIVLSMMNQLASVAYLKMGIPESVNLKYRDFKQAKLAIDALDAMLRAAEGGVAEEGLQPFKGALANLKMNFVKIKRASDEE